MANWISVEERLPSEKGEYLVVYHPCYWDDVKPELRAGIDTFRGKSVWAKNKYQRVTHWMPLPEPPEEREMENKPLTLDELRTMDAQPVWMQAFCSGWVLVWCKSGGNVFVTDASGMTEAITDIRNAKFYRNPVKEDRR